MKRDEFVDYYALSLLLFIGLQFNWISLTTNRQVVFHEATQLPSAPQQMLVPDGTPIELRFAQAVVGRGSKARADSGVRYVPVAEQGDKVRLVCTTNVRVGQEIAFPKGAIGEATVTKVKNPMASFSYAGIALRLDWVEAVDGQRLPVRASVKGATDDFMVQVIESDSGTIAGPNVHENHNIGQALYHGFVSTKLKQSIPVGARILGFVDGNAKVDVGKNQKGLETRAVLPTLTVFQKRTKGPLRAVVITCDDRPLGRIGYDQYLTVTLSLGRHSCWSEQNTRSTLEMRGGSAYFLRIDTKTQVLTVVSEGEGEDSIANLQIADVPEE